MTEIIRLTFQVEGLAIIDGKLDLLALFQTGHLGSFSYDARLIVPEGTWAAP